MTQIEFLRLWMRGKPAQVKRRTWHCLGMQAHQSFRSAMFPIRHPRMWWFCRRCDLHFRYGFPRPLTDTERGILRA